MNTVVRIDENTVLEKKDKSSKIVTIHQKDLLGGDNTVSIYVSIEKLTKALNDLNSIQ